MTSYRWVTALTRGVAVLDWSVAAPVCSATALECSVAAPIRDVAVLRWFVAVLERSTLVPINFSTHYGPAFADSNRSNLTRDAVLWRWSVGPGRSDCNVFFGDDVGDVAILRTSCRVARHGLENCRDSPQPDFRRSRADFRRLATPATGNGIVARLSESRRLSVPHRLAGC